LKDERVDTSTRGSDLNLSPPNLPEIASMIALIKRLASDASMCACVCVCERERGGKKEREKEGERERKCVCVTERKRQKER